MADHPCASSAWLLGPTAHLFPATRVLVFEPGPRCNHHVYLSIGASHVRLGVHRWFCSVAQKRTALWSKSLQRSCITITAKVSMLVTHFQSGGHGWLARHSISCSAFRIRLDLPWRIAGSRGITFGSSGFWLSTNRNVAFDTRKGLEALESRFEAAEIDCLALDRPPVI